MLVCEGHADMLLTLFLMLMLSDECHVTLFVQLEVALKGHASIPAQQSGCSVKCVETGTTACVQTLTARQLSKTVMFFYCILCKLE